MTNTSGTSPSNPLPDPVPDPILTLLEAPLARLAESFAQLPPRPSPLDIPENRAAMDAVLEAVADRMVDNYPYFHPLYAGQMLKPPHPVARAAYTLAMAINPNNHARDGGRASSQMEIEAVAEIARMFGWPRNEGDGFLGHLTSGGTCSRAAHSGPGTGPLHAQTHHLRPETSFHHRRIGPPGQNGSELT